MDFETALREQFQLRRGGKRLSRWERKLKELLEAKPSKRRTRILARLENHARVALGKSQDEKIDWQNIDWNKVFDFLLNLLLALLPFLLAL